VTARPGAPTPVRAQILDNIRRRCQERGLDAYLAYTPSNVHYTSGFQSYFLSEWPWRMLGTVLVLVPADPALEPAMIISDFEAEQARRVSGIADVRPFRVWVELRSAADLQVGAGPDADVPRPAQFSEDEQDAMLRSALADRGLLGARIGTDMRYVLQDTVRRIAGFAPDVDLVDMTEDVYELRSIKHDFEIEALRRATELSEAGMTFAASSAQPGMTALDMRHRYALGVIQAAMGTDRYAGFSDHWVLPAVGATTAIGVDSERGIGLVPGDLIKFDCGTTVDGYRGDGGRTFSFREIRPAAQRLYRVLLEAHELARERLTPGRPVREVFAAAESHIQLNGFPRFTRGHYGHSVGLDTFHEEPPFLSRTEERLIQPGMVFAVETPAYSSDTGAVMIEDLVVITATGHEVLHQLPHELVVVP
jgi:Xaa-Pro dipeptidase